MQRVKLLGPRIRTDWIVGRCASPHMRILDIGAHDGAIFNDSGLDVTLLDINGYPDSGLRRVIADAHELPFEDNSYDICTLNEILEHVHDPPQVLREAARVARLKVVFTVPSEEHWGEEHHPFMSLEETLQRRGLTEEEHFWASNPTCTQFNDMSQAGHRRYYNNVSLRAELARLGLPYSTMWLPSDAAMAWWVGEIYMSEFT